MKRIAIAGIEQGCSQLVMGSMMLAEDRMEFVHELLDTYVVLGGNTIDTAYVYGPSSNKAVGLWMASRGNRDQMVIIGKGAHHDQHGPRVNREAIAHDLEVSLERLQTDYVDIYMLHRDDPEKPVGYILEAMNEQLEAGRCRAIGTSNWTYSRIQEANEYASRHGLTGFVCNSPNLSLAKPNEPRWPGCISVDRDYAAWHERTQMPLLSWSSQAGGFFTDRYAPERTDDKEAVRVYYSEANWERKRRAEQLGREKQCSANHIALAFVLHQPFPVCALIGPANVRELRDSARSLEISLTPDQIKWLDLQE
jgi:aryl-alcohol dehydrogenase-like predicted oxidoreductase